MPKKVFTITDLSGGLNTVKSTRALEDNELSACKNLDPTSKGKVICSRVFRQADANYTDQAESVDNVAGITSGYGLFTFANDYTLADPPVADHTGEFVVKLDGNASADVDILQPVSTWVEGLVTAQSANACFYAAEGDLFVGGDHAKSPRSLTYHAQDQLEGAGGQVADINDWVNATQEKVKPDGTTPGFIQKIFQSSTGGAGTGTTASAQNTLHWVIKPTATGTGLWTNNQDDVTQVYQYACSWLYKGFDPVFGVNTSESDLFTLQTGNSMTGAADFTSESVSSQAWVGNGTPITSTYFTNKYGARLYSRYAGDGEGDWYLLAEMDLEKGIRGSGESDWKEWGAQAADDAFDNANDTGDSCATGLISAPPALITFKIANGYAPSDIPTSGLAYFRTAVVANSRAYVGNVKINGRVYGDRILKSPIFKYDTFTEGSYLDVAINDGDQITALAAHADRLLQFKHNAVYIINISKELEFLEDEQQGAGVGWQAAVVTTPFGVVWINSNACYLYDGEKISQLQLGKISSSDWSTNIDSTTPKSTIGYDTIKQQLIVLWDTTSSGSGEAYIFDAETGSWYQTDDILVASPTNCTNMVNARGDKLLIGGNAAIEDINFLDDRIAGNDPTIDLQTKVFDFGNSESKKNLLEVAVVYKYGNAALDVNISADHAAYVEAGSGSEGLLTTTAGPTLVEIDTSGQSAFQGKKTFQVQIEGTADSLFELHSISLTYRELGVH